MQVAWWIFLRNAPATVRDVCSAFHISARRAGDIFLYLYVAGHVTCQRHWVPSPYGGRCRALTVSGLSVRSASGKRETVSRRPPVKQAVPRARHVRQPEDIRTLRTWMVSRRAGESVPMEDDAGVLPDGEK